MTDDTNAIVAIYKSHVEAEASVNELQRSGFDVKKLSIAGRDYHTEEHVLGYYNIGDRIRSWGRTGAFWGSIWDMETTRARAVIARTAPEVAEGHRLDPVGAKVAAAAP